MSFFRLAAAALLVGGTVLAQGQQGLAAADRQLAHDVFQQLIEINTTDSVGSTTAAAEAMRQRLLAAGFPAADLMVMGPNERKGNLVARYRGAAGSSLKPILVICHVDVVEAKRSDWTTDPFKFTEKDGYFYGRGTQDMKDSDAILVTDFIRLKREGYVPDRDIVLALTADEEGGASNGVSWLLQHHRELMDADFVLNPDAGGITSTKNKPVSMGVEATEKLYADYVFATKNPGGHSSVPGPENAIYELTDALGRVERAPFPFELNEVTRAYYERMAKIDTGQRAADISTMLRDESATDAGRAAIARLSKDPVDNSTMRTTCVATMIQGGHAPNALPGAAQANVNCRILPGHSQEEVRQELIKIAADPRVTVSYKNDAGEVLGLGSTKQSMKPPPLKAEVMDPLKKVVEAMWPGLPVVPEMETGASDSIFTMGAGLPSYGISGVAIDRDDDRAHGRDERVWAESYYTGVVFYYKYLKALTEK